MQNTIGYVSSERNLTTEEMNTELDLTSSVEINFKSDYLPLNHMASPGQVNRITGNSLNPDAERDKLRAEQAKTRAADSASRRKELGEDIRSAPQPPMPKGKITDMI